MKNIHILPTDKPSRLWMDSDNNLNLHIIPTTLFKMQNIYITSDECIKEGDYCIIVDAESALYGQFEKHKGKHLRNDQWEKIILTTDQDLIADGVQAIDDEFLEWFVKNPSCEEVEVKIECTNCDDCNCQYHDPCLKPKYNIVKDMIRYSKEEPKQIKCYCGHTITCDCEPKQETAEEAAVINYKELYQGEPLTQEVPIDAFIEGAKWQQEQYEILFDEYHEYTVDCIEVELKRPLPLQKWFKQFKKK
jgi:hypothetical protein